MEQQKQNRRGWIVRRRRRRRRRLRRQSKTTGHALMGITTYTHTLTIELSFDWMCFYRVTTFVVRVLFGLPPVFIRLLISPLTSCLSPQVGQDAGRWGGGAAQQCGDGIDAEWTVELSNAQVRRHVHPHSRFVTGGEAICCCFWSRKQWWWIWGKQSTQVFSKVVYQKQWFLFVSSFDYGLAISVTQSNTRVRVSVGVWI